MSLERSSCGGWCRTGLHGKKVVTTIQTRCIGRSPVGIIWTCCLTATTHHGFRWLFLPRSTVLFLVFFWGGKPAGAVPVTHVMEKPSFVWRTRTTSDNLVIGHTDLRARCPGEDLCILRMSFEDDAYSTVNNWISQLDDGEPGVLAIFAPSANIIGTALVPANGLQILNEANSIVNHYAPFTAANFNGIPSPAIPGTIPAPQMPINVQHRSARAPSAHSKSASSKLPSLVGFAIWVVHLQCSYSVGKCGSNNGSL